MTTDTQSTPSKSKSSAPLIGGLSISLVIAIIVAIYFYEQNLHLTEYPPGARPRGVKISSGDTVVFEVIPARPRTGEKIKFEASPGGSPRTTTRVIISGPTSSHMSDYLTTEVELDAPNIKKLNDALEKPPGTVVELSVNHPVLHKALDDVLKQQYEDPIQYRVTFIGWYADSTGTKHRLSVEEKDELEPGRIP